MQFTVIIRNVIATIFIIMVLDIFAQQNHKEITNGKSYLSPVCNFIENKGQFDKKENLHNTEIRFIYAKDGFKMALTKSGFYYEVVQFDRPEWSEAGTLSEDQPIKVRGQRVDVSFVGANGEAEVVKDEESNYYINYYLVNEEGREYLFVKDYRRIIYKNIYPKIDIVFSIINNKPKYDFVLHPGADLNDIKLQYSGADNISLTDSNSLILKTSLGDIIEKIPVSFQYSYENTPTENVDIQYVCLDNIVSFKGKKYNKKKTLVIDPVPGIMWSTYCGGKDGDDFRGLAIDSKNSVVVYGYTYSPYELATPGAFIETNSGGSYGCPYFAKYDSIGQLLWVSYFFASGGSSTYLNGIAVDKYDDFYLTGIAGATPGIGTPGSFQEHQVPLWYGDAFIVKFDPAGARIWGTYYGGPSVDGASGIAIDNTDHVIICGYSRSLTNIATPGSYQPFLHGDGSAAGGTDGFIVKFNPNGYPVWGTYYGGRKEDLAIDLTCDSQNNIIVLGYTNSTDSISTPTGFQTNYGGGDSDNFILKLDSIGNVLWSTYYGGEGIEGLIGDVEVDHNDNIVVGQMTYSTNNIASSGAFQEDPNSIEADGALVKFDPSGNRLWGTYFGGTLLDGIVGVDIDLIGNIFVTGRTSSTSGLATPNAFKMSFGENTPYERDAFIAKFSAGGNRIWSTYFGGEDKEVAYDIGLDHSNHILIAGLTSSYTRISTPNGADQTYNSYNYIDYALSDGFLAKFSDSCKVSNVAILPLSGRSFCVNDSLLLYTISSGSHFWSTGGTSNSIYVKSPLSYSAVIIDSIGCLLFTDTANVTSNSIPVVSIQPSRPLEFCMGDSTVLASSVNTSYVWSDGSMLNSITVKQSGVFSVTVSDTNNCQNSDSVTVTVNPLPLPVIVAPDLELCQGDSIELTSPLYSSYHWSDGTTGNKIIIKTTGDYFVNVIDAKGCENNSNHLQFNFNPVPESSDFTMDTTLCEGDLLVLINKNSGTTFMWSDGSTGNHLLISESGKYWVITTLGECFVKDSIDVSYIAPLELNLGTDTSMCAGQDLVLSSKLNASAEYHWSDGQTTPSIVVHSPGSYSLTIEYYSCPLLEDTILVRDLREVNYFVPNLITPNGDEKNEYLEIGNILPHTKLDIYNRWGNLIYSNGDYKNHWQDVNSDVYFYHISNTQFDCVNEYKGWLQVVR